MTLSIELSGSQVERLQQEAARLGVQPQELARAAVVDLLAEQSPEFEVLAARVLEKNRELYRRLS
jgi:hypothetical protein